VGESIDEFSAVSLLTLSKKGILREDTGDTRAASSEAYSVLTVFSAIPAGIGKGGLTAPAFIYRSGDCAIGDCG
jgi:hypothetical protein